MAIRRNLKAHNNLLLDVIKRQAGTLEKSILEAVMNAIEAGSKRVDITFETNDVEFGKPGARLIIQDQGKGFRSEQEIHEWFETFGTPHDDSENKIWAQFRMGRGQCFAFGKNTWRTGEFNMVVDIDNMGLEYELETGLSHFEGCQIVIDLYKNPIGGYNYHSVNVLKSAIKRQIEFMEGEITFNGERLNIPASELVWDIEDDFAYYMFGKGQHLSFYNLGALVMNHSAIHAGVTGVVVSKKMLKVNFARNDILNSCPVYEKLQQVIRDNRIKKIRKQKRSLNNNERMALLCDLRDGIVTYSDVKSLKLIELSNDKFMSLDQIRKIRIPWSIAPHGNRIADQLQYLDLAVCISEDIINTLDYSGDSKNFFDWLLCETYVNDKDMESRWSLMRQCFHSFKGGLSKGFNNASIRLSYEKWTKAERRLVRVLENYNCWEGRAIGIGTSDTSCAWTDGSSYICLSREYIQKCSPNSVHGASHLIMTLFHELAHNESSEDTHHHGMEFYRNFHNIVAGEGHFSSPAHILADLPKKLKNLRKDDYYDNIIKKEKKSAIARDKKLGIVKSNLTCKEKSGLTLKNVVKA